MVTFRARDGQCGRAARRLAADRDQRRAGKARLSGAVDEHGGRDRRQGRDGVDRLDPGAGDGEVDRVPSRRSRRLESRIAWRSEPGPLSAVVLTTKTPSVIANCVWSGGAPSDWASSVRVAKTCGPGGRGVGHARPAPR